jgi:hypothetical protein
MYVWCHMYAMYGNDFIHVCLSNQKINKKKKNSFTSINCPKNSKNKNLKYLHILLIKT